MHLSQVMYPTYSSSFVNSSSSSITTLDLSNNSLNSSMYQWLFPLTSNKLSSLDLSDNALDGIPQYLGNLCGLTYLWFYGNSAAINFPDFLRNLSGCTSVSLQYLDASGSQLIGPFSDEIQTFSSQRVLYLYDNHLNGDLSEKLWELPMLETLDVSSNFLSGAISRNIGKSKLLKLNLSNNSLEGVSEPYADHMLNHSYVEYIDMRSCKLGPHFPKWIQKLKNLTCLDISNTRIADAVPIEFWDMWPSQLRYLNISSNNITMEVPDLLSNFDDRSIIDRHMTSLNYLDVSYNNLSGRLPSSTQLQSFDASRYNGNTGLCGPPITRNYIGDDESKVPPPTVGEPEGGEEDTDDLQKWFYIGGGIGFATGFWIACGILVLKNHLKHAFFTLLIT